MLIAEWQLQLGLFLEAENDSAIILTATVHSDPSPLREPGVSPSFEAIAWHLRSIEWPIRERVDLGRQEHSQPPPALPRD